MNVIAQNLQQLGYLRSILQLVSLEHYQHCLAWPGEPSIGKHSRHVLDHYQQLWLASESKQLDYRLRLRDLGAQTEPSIALQWIDRLETWLHCLELSELDRQLQYQFDGGATYTSLQRELDFVCSHTVHHLALINGILLQLDYPMQPHLGLHSSTLEYLQQCAP
ncbi:MAG: DinB family protein [Alkalimonas sp.]|nr:DinB family protein [Alkalimonas sp.]